MNNSFYTFKNLQPDTGYRIRIWEFTENNEVFEPFYSKWLTTNSLGFKPLPPQSLNISKTNLDPTGLEIIVEFEQNEGETFFKIFLFLVNSNFFKCIFR